MEVRRHDIVLVGGGAAGLRAAIAAIEADPELSVACVSKLYPMRSHTVSAEGGAAGVVRFTLMPPKERTWFATDKTGFHMLHTLFQTSLRYDRIACYDECFATRILIDQGRAAGVAAIDLRSGETKAVLGRAVVLCTGGAGRIFPFTTNGAVNTGDGMALAYRVGVGLKDMEFVPYHPTALPRTGILATEASRGEGGVLKNARGERFLLEYDYGVGDKAELGPRDLISRAEIREL